MNKLILIGSGGHARPVISAALLTKKWQIEGIIDLDYKNNDHEQILGIPVLGSFAALENYLNKDLSVFISIGDNYFRKKIYDENLFKKFKYANIIHPKSIIDNSAVLGELNFIGPFVNIGPEVKIGNNNIINSYANIEHGTKIGNCCQICPSTNICGNCHIYDNVFLGTNSTVIPNITIESDNRIGAGSTIINNILVTGKTIVGVPGKVL